LQSTDYHAGVDEHGLINDSAEPHNSTEEGDRVAIKKARPKAESLEKIQQGFSELVGRLGDINEKLGRQVDQQQGLMKSIEKLPDVLENFPSIAENQERLSHQLLEQLKTSAVKEEQFIESVGKIPSETAKQTDALVDMNHQLSAAADVDAQMSESFNKFNETLDKLNDSTVGHKDSIMQMSKTFATSDRYLKYIITRQNKRFMWVFSISLIVCVMIIIVFAGIIVYLKG